MSRTLKEKPQKSNSRGANDRKREHRQHPERTAAVTVVEAFISTAVAAEVENMDNVDATSQQVFGNQLIADQIIQHLNVRDATNLNEALHDNAATTDALVRAARHRQQQKCELAFERIDRATEILKRLMKTDFSKETVRMSAPFMRLFVDDEYENKMCESRCTCFSSEIHGENRLARPGGPGMEIIYPIHRVTAFACALKRPKLPHYKHSPIYMYREKDNDGNHSMGCDYYYCYFKCQSVTDDTSPRTFVRFLIKQYQPMPHELPGRHDQTALSSVLLYGNDSLIVDCSKFPFENSSRSCNDIYHFVFYYQNIVPYGEPSEDGDILLMEPIDSPIWVQISERQDPNNHLSIDYMYKFHFGLCKVPDARLRKMLLLTTKNSQLFTEILEARSCCNKHSGMNSYFESEDDTGKSARCKLLATTDPTHHYIEVMELEAQQYRGYNEQVLIERGLYPCMEFKFCSSRPRINPEIEKMMNKYTETKKKLHSIMTLCLNRRRDRWSATNNVEIKIDCRLVIASRKNLYVVPVGEEPTFYLPQCYSMWRYYGNADFSPVILDTQFFGNYFLDNDCSW